MLASALVVGAVDTLRDPAPRVARVEKSPRSLRDRLPSYLPDDPTTLVRLNAAAQVGAGLMLATGRMPRVAAGELAGTLVPTTVIGHPFWTEDEPAARRQQRMQFAKNVSMLGGLLLTVVDTEGRPGVAWRARHAGHHASSSAARTRRTARREAKLVAHSARHKLPV